MPELPEVEAARRAIQDNCVGKRIKKCTVADDPKVIDGVSPSEFESCLNGKTIVAAHRKGKNLWLQLDSPPFPSFQFGMAGAVYIKGVAVTQYKRSAVGSDDEWPSKYSKVFVELDDGLEFSFTDKRRFARVRLLQNPISAPPISELGPDALFEPMKIDEFVDALRKKKIAIKALLLDQSFISGIGNWIADEVLYQAQIHPLQPAASLSKESCQSLHCCIREVIQYSVDVDADSKSFPIEWLFHYRWGKKSGKVNGKKIEFITAGGRTSAFVPELQKLSGESAGKKAQQSKAKRKESGGREAPDSEEEQNGNSRSKKSKMATGGDKKRQRKASTDNSDSWEKQTPKSAKKALGKRSKERKIVATAGDRRPASGRKRRK